MEKTDLVVSYFYEKLIICDIRQQDLQHQNTLHGLTLLFHTWE